MESNTTGSPMTATPVQSPSTGYNDHGPNWLLAGLQHLYSTGKHCDVRVQVDKQTFNCHKVVLSAASTYFDALFSSGMRESTTDMVELTEMRASTFQSLLTFVYYGMDVVNAENAESLLYASSFLQIPYLRAHCERFLIGQMAPENCIGMWSTGRLHSCPTLETHAWGYIRDNFDLVWDKEEFFKVTEDDLMQMVMCDDLCVTSEEIVCKAVFRWLDANLEGRTAAFYDIFPHLKLADVGLEYLLEEVDTNPTIHNNEQCQSMVKNAIKYHALPAKRHTLPSVDTSRRRASGMCALFVVIGRRELADGDSVADVIAYSQSAGKWYSMCTLPYDVGDDFVTCPYGDDIFLSGGSSQPEAFLRFSAKTYRWKEKATMLQGRYRHAMVAARDSVYCLGGYDFGTLADVEEYDISADSWQTVGELNIAVDGISAAVLGENIYIFGGRRGFADDSDVIQCFNTETKTCFEVGTLPSPCRDTRAVTYDGSIHVVCPHGDVMLFKSDHTLDVVDVIEGFNKQSFGLHVEKDTLYVFGGYECLDSDSDEHGKTSDQVLAIGLIKTETCVPIEGLPVPFQVHGCYNTAVRSKYPLVEFAELID